MFVISHQFTKGRNCDGRSEASKATHSPTEKRSTKRGRFMNALISNNPILVVAAALVALVISTMFVAVARVAFRIVGIAVQAVVLMAAARLLLVLAPIFGVVLAVAYLRH